MTQSYLWKCLEIFWALLKTSCRVPRTSPPKKKSQVLCQERFLSVFLAACSKVKPLMVFFFILITCLLDIVRRNVVRNSVLVTHGSLRLTWSLCIWYTFFPLTLFSYYNNSQGSKWLLVNGKPSLKCKFCLFCLVIEMWCNGYLFKI